LNFFIIAEIEEEDISKFGDITADDTPDIRQQLVAQHRM